MAKPWPNLQGETQVLPCFQRSMFDKFVFT